MNQGGASRFVLANNNPLRGGGHLGSYNGSFRSGADSHVHRANLRSGSPGPQSTMHHAYPPDQTADRRCPNYTLHHPIVPKATNIFEDKDCLDFKK